jgi:hypothetical protein
MILAQVRKLCREIRSCPDGIFPRTAHQYGDWIWTHRRSSCGNHYDADREVASVRPLRILGHIAAAEPGAKSPRAADKTPSTAKDAVKRMRIHLSC